MIYRQLLCIGLTAALSMLAGYILGKRSARKPYDALCQHLRLLKIELEVKRRFLACDPGHEEEITQTRLDETLARACRRGARHAAAE